MTVTTFNVCPIWIGKLERSESVLKGISLKLKVYILIVLQYCAILSSGDAGGQLGLVLGASFITLLEVIDLVIMFAINWFRSKPPGKTSDIS